MSSLFSRSSLSDDEEVFRLSPAYGGAANPYLHPGGSGFFSQATAPSRLSQPPGLATSLGQQGFHSVHGSGDDVHPKFVMFPKRVDGQHSNGWDRSQLKVLVAEDDDVCRKVLIQELKSLGVQYIYAVDNGLEVMRAVRRETFTHVFLDLVLPCIDGYTLAHEISDTCACSNRPTPIMSIVTAHDDPEVHRRCRDAHVDCIYVKPLRRDRLKFVLDAHFESRETRRTGLFSGLVGAASMHKSLREDAKAIGAFTAARASSSHGKVHGGCEGGEGG